MGIFEELANRHPELKRKLIMAKIQREPAQYLKTMISISLLLSLTVAFSAFLFVLGIGFSLWYVPAIFLVTLILSYNLLMRLVDVRIRKVAKDIDR